MKFRPLHDRVVVKRVEEDTKTAGGIMNVVLKSGSNDFHATGWEFLRRTPLDYGLWRIHSALRAEFSGAA